MRDLTQKAFLYSIEVQNELRNILSTYLRPYEKCLCLAVTGSLGKYQLTPASDIDLFGIIIDNISDGNKIKRIVEKKLQESKFLHPFEFYPIVSFSLWKWIAKYSALYSSDLFFSRYIWGNKRLYDQLYTYINKNNIEKENQHSYFVYNLLYRKHQLKYYQNSDNLKYKPGGLRDFQFIKWVSRRIAECTLTKPEEYIRQMVIKKIINDDEYHKLVMYSHSILVLHPIEYPQ